MKNNKEQKEKAPSKTKQLFTRIKQILTEESGNPVEETLKDEGDTFSINLEPLKEKIKTAFKFESEDPNEAHEKSETEPAEEFNIDFGPLKKFLVKYKTPLFLLLVVMLQFMPNYGYMPWGGVWMRLQTEKLPLLDDFAQNSVYNFYRGQIAQAVVQQYPNLPENNLNAIITEQLNKAIKENDAQVKEQIAQTANYLKESFQYEENGIKYTMMPDIDPYQFLRLARNYITYGILGDDVKDGVSWDTKVVAPLGRDTQWDEELHPYVLAYMYKITSFFNPKAPLMQVAAYFPILFVTLAIVFAFLFVKKITNHTGGLFAAIMLGVNAAAVGRTQWGHADTDAYNLFFPMLISWLFVASIETDESKKKYPLILATAFLTGVYAFTWVGWWYVFDFMLTAIGTQIVYTAFFNRTRLKQACITFAAFFLGTGISVTLLRKNATVFILGVLEPLKFNLIKDASQPNLMPNVYTTVAELNPTSFSGAINSLGGTMFIVIGVISILLLLLKRDMQRRNKITYSVFLILWTAATVYATTKGIRFSILISPAISALFGIAAGLTKQKLEDLNKRYWHIKPQLVALSVVIIFGLIIMQSGQVESAYSQSKNDLPIMNKAWWNALTAIKNNSTKDAIINSWWDFGHHFKYVADRAVTFDGANQNSPIAHWIGKTLLTSDEEEAIALLRMLDCGSRNGFDEVFKQTDNDTVKSIKILNELIKIKKRTDAKKYLEKEGFKDTEKILKYTHCNPPENYFITSEDMVAKAGVWSHFGGWNFERAYAWVNLRNKDKDAAITEMMKKLNYSKNDAEQTYFELTSLKDEGAANTWISNWAGYASGFDSCNVINETITCGNGVTVNKTIMDATIRFDRGLAKPRFLSYIDEKTLKFTVKEFNDSQANFAVVLMPSGNIYRAVITSPEHAASMFTRLFYMEGHGLRYFKKFNEQNQLIGGGRITVWKIDWEGKKPNIIEALQQKAS